jgi:SAM-dependent methyltransferase
MNRLLSRFRSRPSEPPPAPGTLPVPPLNMRELVGPTDPAMFDNPSGDPVFAHIDEAHYDAVLDFGCGCGRVARQLIQQRRRPGRYVGIDLHAGMIRWCDANLAPAAPGFSFVHHDVFAPGLNPGKRKPSMRPFPVEDGSMSMVVAISVFTHLLETQTLHYLREARRVLRDDGVLNATFFLFDKSEFPMMQEVQNSLYINPEDPRNAVIYDREWLQKVTRQAGLVITHAYPPEVRGFQWSLVMTPARPGVEAIEIPPDTAPVGLRRAPMMPVDAEQIGLKG